MIVGVYFSGFDKTVLYPERFALRRGGVVLILYLVSFMHGGNVCVLQPLDGKSIIQRGYIQVYFASPFTVGSVTVKTFPSALPSQRIFPPCSDTMLSAIESPRP